jgi:hypothetical protein
MTIKKRIRKWFVLPLKSIIKLILAMSSSSSGSDKATAANPVNIDHGSFLEELFGLKDDPYEEISTRIKKVVAADQETQKRMMPSLGKEFLETAAWGDDRKIRVFVNTGFPMNYQDPKTGSTALHRAAACMARDVVRLLIKREQCNFLIRDNKGRLSSEMAYLYGHDPALARLLGIKERKQAEELGIKLTRRPLPEAKP